MVRHAHNEQKIRSHSKVNKRTSRQEKRIDDKVTATIGTLDLLIAQASSASMGTVARILHTAKEDLVYWAVNMNFYESSQEKFINRMLYQNNMFAAADFLKTLAKVNDKNKVYSELENSVLDKPPFSIVENLR